MSDVISEIIISVLILSMLLIAVPMYRQNQQLVADMVSVTDYNEKIGSVMMPETDKQEISGADVIAAIRYFYVKGGTKIQVIQKKGGFVYDGTYDYDEAGYAIESESRFHLSKKFENGMAVLVYSQI